jgi:flagellar assembly factor FliW
MVDNAAPQTHFTVETTRFGRITVETDKVITLPQGMIGFPRRTRYLFVQHRPDSPLHWMQSLDSGELAFVVVNPLLFEPKYEVVLGKAEMELLKVGDPKDVQVWVVVTIPPGHPEKMTANLRAPLVINLDQRLGAQVILDNQDLPVRKPLT